MIIHLKNYRQKFIGSKAHNLFRLAEAGYQVPPFFCVRAPFREEEIVSYLDTHFSNTTLFSVRSSASIEDGAKHSYAGQFRTFLRVPREAVYARIQDVFAQAQPHKLSSIQMHVIVQEMIEADASGVLFTANPQGLLNESVIVLGAGTGDLVVEDRTDTTTYYYNLSDQIYYYEQTGKAPLLTKPQIQELITASSRIKKRFQTECDIEFALKDQKLWFLQARPITTLDPKAPVIILDNSNIVESYPGITLPLTQSFIKEAYYQVFRHLLLHLTKEPKTVQQIAPVLRHMVDVANGRIYYRISNWYDVLLFLPFSQKIIPIWQEMMGVNDRTVRSHMQHQIRKTTRLRVACSFFRLLLTCPHEIKLLDDYFTTIIKHFDSLHIDTDDNLLLLSYYRSLQKQTVKRWDMTLVNDMYAFLFTGLLKALLKAKKQPDYELAARQAVQGIHRLESLAPIQKLHELALHVQSEGLLNELQKIHSNQDYQRYIQENDNDFTKQLEAYIQEFGDRNIEELKLESKTFRTDPVLLIQYLCRQAEDPFLDRTYVPSSKSIKKPKGLTAFFAKRAALGIRNRETSRLHRSRLYGMMRTFALQMGKNLYTQGRIEEQEDIFWLYLTEIEQAAKDSTKDLRRIITRRKQEYQAYETLPAYSRLVFSGKVKNKHPRSIHKHTDYAADGIYIGTACSQGKARGEVLLIEKPSLAIDARDKILVTKMTDPGWVFLIADAKAIVAEKGSLLSHTAIIARELKKPAVVAVPHITEILKTGDQVQVDGDTGTLILLDSSSNKENTHHENHL